MTTDITETPNQKLALVVTHMLNPNLVQGYPMFAESSHVLRVMIEDCLAQGWSVPVTDEHGTIVINVILGGGMTYQIEEWEAFKTRMEEMRKEAEEKAKAMQEQAAASRFGITGGSPLPPGPRRIR